MLNLFVGVNVVSVWVCAIAFHERTEVNKKSVATYNRTLVLLILSTPFVLCNCN
jgi:hypothetical protein